MGHVGLDQVTGRKGAAEAELAGQHTSRHNPSQLPSIVARVGGMGPSDTQKIEHSALRLEHCAPSNRADFDARHRNADLEIAIVTEIALATDGLTHVGKQLTFSSL